MTNEKLEELRAKVQEVREELRRLSDEELEQVLGGIDPYAVGGGRFRMDPEFNATYIVDVRHGSGFLLNAASAVTGMLLD